MVMLVITRWYGSRCYWQKLTITSALQTWWSSWGQKRRRMVHQSNAAFVDAKGVYLLCFGTSKIGVLSGWEKQTQLQGESSMDENDDRIMCFFSRSLMIFDDLCKLNWFDALRKSGCWCRCFWKPVRKPVVCSHGKLRFYLVLSWDHGQNRLPAFGLWCKKTVQATKYVWIFTETEGGHCGSIPSWNFLKPPLCQADSFQMSQWGLLLPCMPGLDGVAGSCFRSRIMGPHQECVQKAEAEGQGRWVSCIFWSRNVKFGELKPTWHPGNFESTQILHSIRQSGKPVVFQVVFALVWTHSFLMLYLDLCGVSPSIAVWYWFSPYRYMESWSQSTVATI